MERSTPQKIRLELSPQAEKYARRDAPREVRLMAARGALPLPPVELATVLFALMHDDDAEIKSTARDSLEALPEGVIDRGARRRRRTRPCSTTSPTPSPRTKRGSRRSRSTPPPPTAPSRSWPAARSSAGRHRLEQPGAPDALPRDRGRARREPAHRPLGDRPHPLLPRRPERRRRRGRRAPPIPAEEISDEEARAALAAVLGASFAALVEEHDDESTRRSSSRAAASTA